MIDVFVPRENVNDESVVIRALHAQPKQLVKAGDLIVEFETSKTNIDIESPVDGIISINLEIGSEVGIGSRLFSIYQEHELFKREETSSEVSQMESGLSTAIFSAAALLRASELKVDKTLFKGGWITVEDVESFAGLRAQEVLQYTAITNDSLRLPPVLAVDHERMGISKRKQAEIQNLELGSLECPASTIGIEIELEGIRVVPPPFLFHETISDLVVYEASRLFKKYPELNAAYIDSKHWARFNSINFGWSFDNGENLKVLSIDKADKFSLIDLQKEVLRLLELYESGKSIPMGTLTSSTVTISDLSSTPTSFMLPLLNGRQSLILGITSNKQRFFKIFATFDHRITEGLRVSQFLSELKDRVLTYFHPGDYELSIKCCACEKSMKEELSCGHRGFLKIILPSGSEGVICRNCWDGW